MLQAARHQAILEMVQKERIVKVSDLADALKVSAMTVRRDIESLSDSGLLERIHGGAKVLGETGTHEPGFELKSTQNTAEKQAIARAAAARVSEGMAVGLSAGTTTWALAQELVKGPAITVVTNSIRTAEIFYRSTSVHPRTDVILIGGQRTASDALVGPLSTQALKTINLDVTFLGVHGMDAQAGFSTPNVQEAETDRAFLASSRTLVVVADHSKWGVQGISSIAALDAADELITDPGLGQNGRTVLAEHVRRLTIAPL
ncbi:MULTISPECIES: DeoR/GlpR family DNA-binding transcription regulator [Arthrobacter]|uniref:DeoR/GlpR family DNA-binding transcription regulator n=2 Tax=Arthrobacter TaxID=1663 RepID=A0ABU9KL09_9MICC|nr:DeoR/GlpR family DNA-binding transcription regulator [Arthrobacter sp. YJM1]MDP5227585.1 DeoR/GlpR family DNA-binding transcription regulator [Arthrobacter sp. YJM1]